MFIAGPLGAKPQSEVCRSEVAHDVHAPADSNSHEVFKDTQTGDSGGESRYVA
jgi:hypothetical protein